MDKAFLFLLGLISIGRAYAQVKITSTEARHLVDEGLRSHDPSHAIELSQVENRYDRVFMYFEASWPNPVGSPHLGNFAVNPWTGDVFDSDNCKPVVSQSLRKLQDAVRKKLRLKQEEYTKLHERKPVCATE